MVVKTTTGGSAWTELYYGGLSRGYCFADDALIQGGEWDDDGDLTDYKMAVSICTDEGSTWHHSKLNDVTGRVLCVAAQPDNSDIIYAGGQETNEWRARLFKSTDGAGTWTQLGASVFQDVYSITSIIIDPSNYNKILVGTGSGVFISEDAGETWTSPARRRNVTDMVIDPNNPDRVFVGSYTGFCYSTDGGLSWTEHNSGFYSQLQISCLDFDAVNNVLYAGTRYSGVYRLAFTNDVKIGRESYPEAVTLYENYPNPFNGTTRIGFTLVKPDRITLSVFDIRGRKVRTLLDCQMTAGDHSFVWDGTGDRGNQLPSGVYVCRLEATGLIDSKKIVLQK